MKFNKFEGSFGEFIEKYLEGSTKFYTLDAGHGYEITFGEVEMLSDIYKSGDIYVEAKEIWTDHLPVLCWVWREGTPQTVCTLCVMTSIFMIVHVQ